MGWWIRGLDGATVFAVSLLTPLVPVVIPFVSEAYGSESKKNTVQPPLKDRDMKRAQGFSLIELMIVVAVIGILAAVAVPQYNQYILKSKLAEARAELSDARVRMERYFQDNRRYNGPAALGECGVEVNDFGEKRYFNYVCAVVDADGDDWAEGYTVTATGIAAQGTANFAFTINQDNDKVTTSVPADWTINAGCWVTGPGGGC